jgi:glycerol-3-phosphate dehydrogenase subunit B
VDVLGYLPDREGAIFEPLQAVNDLLAQHPDHPYGLLDAGQLASTLADFATLTEALELPYAGSDQPGRNLLLPSPVGAARPAFLAPAAQRAGDLADPSPMLIVGFEGMRDFYPALIAANLAKLGIPARPHFLPFNTITDRRDINTVQMAHAIEDEAALSRLASGLKRAVKPGERIGLPAILGVEEHGRVFSELEKRVGAPLFEIPTLPPSVPGIRLHTALRHRLLSMGVRVEAGMEAMGFHAADGRIRWVETETSARPLKHRAGAFLLATGGVLGGGFYSDPTGRFWDAVFDLPLTVPQDRSRWFSPRFLEGQPVFSGGVAVNRDFQPIHPEDASGQPIYANLWAAGGALAHADGIHERSLEGIAVVTGSVVGQRIAA